VSAERRMRRRIVRSSCPASDARCSATSDPPRARAVHSGARGPHAVSVAHYRPVMVSRRRGGSRARAASTGNRAEVPPRRVFTRQGLRRMGVSERRLRSEEFVRVLPWCYTRRDAPADLRAIAGIARRRVVPGAVICHVTAAELLGLPLPRRLTRAGAAPVHVRVGPEAKRRSAEGLVVHVRSGGRSTDVDALVLDWPVDVLLDLAGLLAPDELIACVDALASRRRERLRIPVETIRTEARSLRAPGVRALRAAAAQARDWVDSPQETATRLLLLRAGFDEPRTNHRVWDEVKRKEYYLD